MKNKHKKNEAKIKSNKDNDIEDINEFVKPPVKLPKAFAHLRSSLKHHPKDISKDTDLYFVKPKKIPKSLSFPIAKVEDKDLTLKKTQNKLKEDKGKKPITKKSDELKHLKIINAIMNNFTAHLKEKKLFVPLTKALRYIDLNILPQSYINLLIFSSIITFVIVFIINIFISSVLISLFRALLSSILVFLVFYTYPFIKLQSKKRSIDMNLPFAIIHLSSLSQSSILPVDMIRIIAKDKEYGELSNEFEKLVGMVDIYGYDFSVALQELAKTTPSIKFQEFLNGFYSAIKSGTSIADYLNAKAHEYLTNYEINMQKKNQEISTYTDIYVALMIAGPLFLMVILALVSILGGEIGKMNVNTIIIYFTYILIPLINIIYLMIISLIEQSS